MRKLYIGTNVVALRGAIKQVTQNIAVFQEKVTQSHGSTRIQKFYKDKVSAQKKTRKWLKKYYANGELI